MRIEKIKIRSFQMAGVEVSARELGLLLVTAFALLAVAALTVYVLRALPVGLPGR